MKTAEYSTTPMVSLGHATNKDDSESSSAYLIFPESRQLTTEEGHQNQVWYTLFAESTLDTECQAMAAQLSVESMYRYMVDNYTNKSQVRYALEAALCHANSTLLRVSQQEKISTAFCTSALGTCIDRDRFYITYVGDIHAYLLRSGLIYHLAHAVTINTPSSNAGHRNTPQEETKYYLGKTAIPLVKHISFNVSTSFASKVFPPDRQVMNYLQLRADDIIVLCSSGVSSALTPRELGAIATAHDTQHAAEEMAKAAEAQMPDKHHVSIVLRQNQIEPAAEYEYVMPTRHRNIAAMAY